MAKYVLFTLGIAAVVTLGTVIHAQSSPPVVPRADQVEECRVFALGRVEGITAEIELRSQLTGRIVDLPVTEGQFVEEGQVLLVLEDQRHLCEVELATAEVELARANLAHLVNGAHPQERAEAAAMYRAKLGQLELAKRAWKRISELIKAEAVSRQKADDQEGLVAVLTAEVEAAKARLQRIEAQARDDEIRMEQARIQAAESRLELANVELDRTRILAPCRGRILEVDVEKGELTGPESAQAAITMADTTTLQVRAFVDEIDAPRVKVGMTSVVRADGIPDREFQGRVVRLSPRMGRKQLWSDQPAERFDTKTRQVWIELEGAESLVVGLRVDAMIDSGTLATQVTAP